MEFHNYYTMWLFITLFTTACYQSIMHHITQFHSMTERHYHLYLSHNIPQSKYCIYFSCHLHVTCYKTHIMMPLNMQLPVTTNFLSLNISLSFPFPNTLSLQLFPMSDTSPMNSHINSVHNSTISVCYCVPTIGHILYLLKKDLKWSQLASPTLASLSAP